MKIYKITKIGKVENPHSNSTFGESSPFHIGFFVETPQIGERFNLLEVSNRKGEMGISTSPVVRIINENTFETLNSIYVYEPYDSHNS